MDIGSIRSGLLGVAPALFPLELEPPFDVSVLRTVELARIRFYNKLNLIVARLLEPGLIPGKSLSQ